LLLVVRVAWRGRTPGGRSSDDDVPAKPPDPSDHRKQHEPCAAEHRFAKRDDRKKRERTRACE
jgi:hypothetical protein